MKQLDFEEWLVFNDIDLSVDPGTDGEQPAIKCAMCEGYGYKVCDLDHEHECNACDGTGVIEIDDWRDVPDAQRRECYKTIHAFECKRDLAKLKRYASAEYLERHGIK